MSDRPQRENLSSGVRFMLSHSLITLLAIGIAFALPDAARYILFYWWPHVKADANVLLASEILFAGLLALLFNVIATSWDNRRFVDSAKLASLVHARSGNIRRDLWRERRFNATGLSARDVFIVTVTGAGTFTDEGSPVRAALRRAYEVRVMLINPAARAGAARCPRGPDGDEGQSLLKQLEASIALLASLRRSGRKVSLKLYAGRPFWKLVILGEQVWVQYCHEAREPTESPEYVFALDQRSPRDGLFVPFYMLFLNMWSSPQHPEYDFERRELVYRDELGNELRREPILLSSAPRAGEEAPRAAQSDAYAAGGPPVSAAD